MYETSKAIIFERPGKAVLKEISLPAKDNQTIVVKTKFSAISTGTEMNLYNGVTPPLEGSIWYPMLPGYEGVGEVVEVGKDVQEFKIADRVMANNTEGYEGICSAWGGQIEYAVKTSKSRKDIECVHIPENVSYEESVIASLAAVAYKGIKRVVFDKKSKVVIIGQGVVGLSALQIFKILGANVMAVDRFDSKLKISKKYADTTVNVLEEDLSERVKEFTDGKLADVVYEATGNSESFAQVIKYCKGSSGIDVGQIHFQGYYPNPIIIKDWHNWFGKSPTMTCSCGHNVGRDVILKWIAEGKFDARSLCTKTVPVDDAPRAYEELKNNRDDILKILIKW